MTKAELVRAGPYRLFFPLGMLCGLLGVGHWFVWGSRWLPESSSFFHATMQAEGFLACFVVGFLMTALPRFLGTRRASNGEVILPAISALVFIGATLVHRFPLAQSSFLVMLGATVIFGLRRLPQRTKNPPSSFVLNAFGLLQGLTGPLLMIASGFSRNAFLMEVGRQMIQVGFLLCLVLGIAGYLTPFLMGYADDPSCDPGIQPGVTRAWKFAFHVFTGVAIVTSFFIEPHHTRAAAGLRALFGASHLMMFAKIWRPIRRRRTPAYFFWLSGWMVAVGLIAAYLWPDYRITALHVTFIGGFSLMIMSFALNVIFSHGAEPEQLQGTLLPLWICGILVLLALGLRVTADIDAWRFTTWIHAAAGTWFVAGLLWLIYVFPRLWESPAE
jgi:uncharacterized protein involved in response to NO